MRPIGGTRLCETPSQADNGLWSGDEGVREAVEDKKGDANREVEVGNGKWEVGSGKWEVGSGKWGPGHTKGQCGWGPDLIAGGRMVGWGRSLICAVRMQGLRTEAVSGLQHD